MGIGGRGCWMRDSRPGSMAALPLPSRRGPGPAFPEDPHDRSVGFLSNLRSDRHSSQTPEQLCRIRGEQGGAVGADEPSEVPGSLGL